MLTFLIRRILTMLAMMAVISFLVYFALNLTPGDPVSAMISPERAAGMSAERLQALREALGLGQPFLVRYGLWLGQIVQGNFGVSLTSGVGIREILMDRLPATLELSGIALLLSSIFGIALGVSGALTRGSAFDAALTGAGMLGVSIPEFFFGLVAILVFALTLGWLPVGGRSLPGEVAFIDRLPHLVLPALVLSTTMTAGVMRYSRAALLDVLHREFVRTARSKGIPEWRVNLLHGFRVAITPVVVLIGFRLPVLIGGSVVIEQVFQWPGIGSLFVSAVQARDYPLVMGIAMLSVLAVLSVSLLVDLLTAVIDPRVRLED